jgi:hypothetical protein
MQRAAGPQPKAQMPSCLIVVGTPSLSPFLLPHPLFRSLSLVRAPLVAAMPPPPPPPPCTASPLRASAHSEQSLFPPAQQGPKDHCHVFISR